MEYIVITKTQHLCFIEKEKLRNLNYLCLSWNEVGQYLLFSWIIRKSDFQISESMFFGDIQVQTDNETLAPDYSTRTMKVSVTLRNPNCLAAPIPQFTLRNQHCFLRCAICSSRCASSIEAWQLMLIASFVSQVRRGRETRTLVQLSYRAWPDVGVPSNQGENQSS